MNLKKYSILLVITSAILLTGCSEPVTTDTDYTEEYINHRRVLTHVTTLQTGDHTDITIYNFINKSIGIYVNQNHVDEIFVESNTNPEHQPYIQAYNRIFNEEIQHRSCETVYGCKSETASKEKNIVTFKEQIISLKASLSDLEIQLENATKREEELTIQLTEVQSSEQKNIQIIQELEKLLKATSAKKEEVLTDLNEYKKLIQSTLNISEIGKTEVNHEG